MVNKNLYSIADELFLNFVKDCPQVKKGRYLSSKTNQILAFEEYINSLNIKQICAMYPSLSPQKAQEVQKIINSGIEKYLIDNIKTLAIY